MTKQRKTLLASFLILLVVGAGGFLLFAGEKAAKPDLPAPRTLEPSTEPIKKDPHITSGLTRFDDDTAETFERGIFDVDAGDRFVFEVDSSWRSEVGRHDTAAADSPAAQLPRSVLDLRVKLGMRGEMQLDILERTAQGYLVRAELSQIRLTAQENATYHRMEEDGLTKPFFFQIDHTGKIAGFAYDAAVDNSTRNLSTSLLFATHQFVLGDGASWQVNGLGNDIGSFSATFSRTVGAEDGSGREKIARVILDYRADKATEIERHQAEASFADGWISAANSREIRRVTFAESIATRVEVRHEIKRLEHTTFPVTEDDVTNAPTRFEKRFTPEVRVFSGSDNREMSTEEARQAAADLMETLAALASADALESADAYQAWAALGDLLRDHPEPLVDDLKTGIREGRIPPGAMEMALTALGRAGSQGSREAVGALASIMPDPEYPERARMASIVASHQVEGNLTPDLIRAATDVILAEDGDGENELSMMASLLMGTFAGTERVSDSDRELITAGLELSRETNLARETPEVYFSTLANAQDPDLLEEAFTFLEDENPQTRAAALAAMGDLPQNPDALTALRAGSQDPERTVRLGVIEGLGAWGDDPDAVELLTDLARSDPDSSLRGQATQALTIAGIQDEGPARDALYALADSEDPRVAEVVQSFESDLAQSQE